MADGQEQINDRVTVGIEQDTTAVSFDGQGNTTTKQTGESFNQEFDKDGEALTDADLAELEGDLDAGAEADAEPEQQEEPEGGDEEAVELPEWDGNNEEVSAAYDGKYITKDEEGKEVLNFEAFNAEFAVDRGEGKRDLNAGTRKYLKDRFGISDALIDSHLAGVIAQEKLMADTFYGQFGATTEEGKKTHGEMLGWAKETYTPAQKARYNAAMKEGGEAAQEQLELLKTRFLTKNPGKSEGTKPGIGLRKERAVSPAKSATSGAAAKAIVAQPFANAEEHRIAQNQALQLSGKERDAKLAEVRQRLQASTFWK